MKPGDFHLIVPKLTVKEGAILRAGDEIFYSRENPEVKFVSPVSGILREIKRGEKRVIKELVIDADAEDTYRDFGKLDAGSTSAEAIKNRLLESGCWVFIKQRPYDVIANAHKTPKAIFISAYASAPLAADYDFTLAGKENELQAAITGLGKLTEGKIHVGIGKNSDSLFKNINGVVLHRISGPHPSGNVGTLINKIDPVNKGEVVWTITPQDLVIIGELFLTGKFNAERIVALAGSSVKSPRYYKTKIGAEVATVVYDSGINEENVRVISGDVLTGKKVPFDGHLGYYPNTITVIPEGDDYDFFGWNKPIFNKLSVTRAMTFSWLTPKKSML